MEQKDEPPSNDFFKNLLKKNKPNSEDFETTERSSEEEHPQQDGNVQRRIPKERPHLFIYRGNKFTLVTTENKIVHYILIILEFICGWIFRLILATALLL